MIIKSLNSSQIALVMKKGRAYNMGLFLFKSLLLSQIEGVASVSFICPLSVSKTAVERNRIKRLLRESFRRVLKKHDFRFVSMIFVAKKTILGADMKIIEKEIEEVLKNNIIK